jgi:tripartite-type tricarboxylate transporter receptor subunit TctC
MATSPAPTVLTSVTHRKLPYDPIGDLSPVSLAAEFQLALVVGSATPAKTLDEYLVWIRADPKRANYGITATGGLVHLFGLMLSRRVGVDMQHIPYAGGAPLAAALAGGQVPAAIMLVAEAIELHKAGKIRILATSGTTRTRLDSSVPTFTERGHPEMVGSGWIAFYAPPGTPRPVIERLAGAIATAVRSPEVFEKLVRAGYEPVGSSPGAFAQRIAEDVAKWRPVAAANGLVID